MKQAETIVVSNRKGGSAKTSTISSLGAGLRSRGFRVLYIDMDSQANLSYLLSADGKALSSLEVLSQTASAEEAIQKTENGDVIAASPSLAGADLTITELGREQRLKEALQPIRKDYDYILIDTAPSLSLPTVNALAAADKLIIPSGADVLSLQGIIGISQTVTSVRKYCDNPGLQIDGVLLVRYHPRTNLSKEVTEYAEQIAAMIGTRVYATRIRESNAVRVAQANRKDIFAFDPRSNAAIDYDNFITEFLRKR